MNKDGQSKKHVQIEKTNTLMLIMIGVAAAVFSFTVVTAISFGRRLSYQSKVINTRVDAEKQLKTNLAAVEKLVSAYEKFDSAETSVLGTKDKNSKIILDALPSKYDFPALTASIEKILKLTGGISSVSLVGSDLEATAEQNSNNPVPIEIPITVNGTASYDTIQLLVNNLQNSIRPFKINKITFSGNQGSMSFSIVMATYYMPEKNLDISQKEVN